jgi:hypothetical protein
MKIKIASGFLVLVTFLSVSLFSLFGHASASFTANNLVDDQIFDNTTSMSAAQIDSFLNSFPKSCISTNNGFSSPDPNGYTAASGYSYGGNVSAGTVIYDSAQAYDINPQVLLATAEKEQSLVTGAAGCSTHAYQAAMGYGCPDGGNCPDSPAVTGFSQQIIHAAWLLKFSEQRAEGNIAFDIVKGNWNNSDDPQSCYSGPMTQGTYQTCPGSAAVYYDGYTTIDGQSVHMDNGATAALYNYTPHFHGNENFDTIFTSWFGSIVGTDLVRSLDNSTVYLISGTNKYPIADQNVLNDFGIFGPISYVSDTYLGTFTTGPTLGHMIGDASTSSLYFVDAGMKLPFSSCSSVADYDYSCSQVIYLSPFQLNQFTTGTYMTNFYRTTSGRSFYISGGKRYEIFDQQSATAQSLTPVYNVLLDRGISYLSYGAPIIRNQVKAIDRDTGTEYYYENGTFTSLTYPMAILPAFSSLPQASLDDASISLDAANNNFNGFVTNASGSQYYALTSAGKALLSTPTQWLPTSSFTTMSDAFLAGVANDTSSPINNNLVKSSSGSTVYYVSNQTLRPIPSWQDLTNLDISPLTITTLSPNQISAIPTGTSMLGPGNLVKSASSSTVYVVKDSQTLLPISSFVFPEELGLNTSVETISSATLAAYTVGSALQSQIMCNGTYYVGINGTNYPFTSGQLTAYGLNSANFVAGGSMCNNIKFNSSALASFVRVGNGTIYQVTGGQKQAFTNYQAYLTHGGTGSNTTQVSDYFASLIPTGASISQ